MWMYVILCIKMEIIGDVIVNSEEIREIIEESKMKIASIVFGNIAITIIDDKHKNELCWLVFSHIASGKGFSHEDILDAESDILPRFIEAWASSCEAGSRFSFDSTNVLSISELSPCVPRFYCRITRSLTAYPHF